jgi:hypothetical protein
LPFFLLCFNLFFFFLFFFTLCTSPSSLPPTRSPTPVTDKEFPGLPIPSVARFNPPLCPGLIVPAGCCAADRLPTRLFVPASLPRGGKEKITPHASSSTPPPPPPQGAPPQLSPQPPCPALPCPAWLPTLRTGSRSFLGSVASRNPSLLFMRRQADRVQATRGRKPTRSLFTSQAHAAGRVFRCR